MTLAGAAAIASALLCFYVAGLSMRLAGAPGWKDERWFAGIALTAALYVACDLPTTLGASDWLVNSISSWQLIAVGANIAGWAIYSELGLRGSSVRPWLKWGAGALVGMGVLSLFPGVILTGRVAGIDCPLLGMTYRLAEPTSLGLAVFAVYCLSVLLIAVRYAVAWRQGVAGAAGHCLGMSTLAVAGVNDSLVSAGLLHTPLLIDLGYVVPVAVAAMSLTTRFVRDAAALADLSATLEHKVAERTHELVTAKELLHRNEKLAAIGQLAAGVAHEINNPAAAVRANLTYLAESLQEGRMPSDALDAVTESLDSVDRIARIVRQLSFASRAVATIEDSNAPVGVLEAVRTSVRLVAKATGVPLPVETDVPANLAVRANEGFVVQVMTNLLTNALHAQDPLRPLRIRVKASAAGERVVVTIEDNGVGMAPEVKRRLFEVFRTTKPVGKGTGLGLAVSLGLIRSMGGTIEVESQLGVGTLIRIELARAGDTAPTQPCAASAPVASASHRPRVLLVDDDAQVLSALCRDLASAYVVTVALGVEAARERLQGGDEFDVILCDLIMPGGGGKSLYELALQERRGLADRFIFITGGAFDEVNREFLAHQPQPVLHKPFSSRESTEAITSILEVKRPPHEGARALASPAA